MCTSFLMRSDEGGAYFGRNMDLFYTLDFKIVITPRNFPISFRMTEGIEHHHAMIGMAVVIDGYPLYCEAANEKGLAVAGLDFPGNACYAREKEEGKLSVSPFELIPFLLAECGSCLAAKELLSRTKIMDIPFSSEIPLSPLHWHIADKDGSFVFEVTKDGQRIYDAPANVMTNNPPFDFHLSNLSQYLNLSPKDGDGSLTKLGIKPFSFGSGGIGLPGDLSSASRFIRAAYLLCNSVFERENGVAHAFRLLSAVSMPKGSVVAANGAYDITLYSACIDLVEKVYYFATNDNCSLRALRLTEERAEGNELLIFEKSHGQKAEFL